MKARPLLMFALLGALAVALAGCDVPTVPDFNYFRLPRPGTLAPVSPPMFGMPIVVEPFNADGLYADQALIYAVDPDAQQLRQYHYQLWTDPPTRILQRRLIAELRAAGASPDVTDELPASHPAIRVGGIILRLDRVPDGTGGWRAVVALKLRADGVDGLPIIDDYYRDEAPAAGKDLKATVDAYGAAIDRIYARFYADLGQRSGADDAR